MNELVLVALLGGVGSVARFALSGWVKRLPWGILLANTAGAVLGMSVLVLAVADSTLSIALAVGLAGGLSTYSTVVGQTAGFWRARQWTKGWWNLLLNVLIPSTAGVLVSIALPALLK